MPCRFDSTNCPSPVGRRELDSGVCRTGSRDIPHHDAVARAHVRGAQINLPHGVVCARALAGIAAKTWPIRLSDQFPAIEGGIAEIWDPVAKEVPAVLRRLGHEDRLDALFGTYAEVPLTNAVRPPRADAIDGDRVAVGPHLAAGHVDMPGSTCEPSGRPPYFHRRGSDPTDTVRSSFIRHRARRSVRSCSWHPRR